MPHRAFRTLIANWRRIPRILKLKLFVIRFLSWTWLAFPGEFVAVAQLQGNPNSDSDPSRSCPRNIRYKYIPVYIACPHSYNHISSANPFLCPGGYHYRDSHYVWFFRKWKPSNGCTCIRISINDSWIYINYPKIGKIKNLEDKVEGMN